MRLFIGTMLAIGIVALAHAFGSVASQDSAGDALDAAYGESMALYEAGQWQDARERFLGLAQAGHAGAEAMMGKIYYHGQGVDQDPVTAAIWLYRSARRGYGAAQLALGSLYRHGTGVAADPAKAYAWFALAELRGGEPVRQEARRLMAVMEDDLAPEAIAAARQWVANWRPVYGLSMANAASQAADD
ncbi:MAG: hypothetical protein Tsb0016_03070 [Sphingomonadales bacterium]